MVRQSVSYIASGLLGLGVCALALLAGGTRLPYQSLDAGLGPAFFPHLLLAVIALISLGLIAYGMLAASGARGTLSLSRAGRPMLLFALTAAFGLLLERVHPTILVFAFLGGAMIIFGERWLRALLFAALATAAITALFGGVFRLPIFLI